MANLDTVWVRVFIPEPAIPTVHLDNSANVTTDAYEKTQYPGRVTEIAQTPEFTPRNVQTEQERVKLVFGVKVTVDNPRHDLKPGMPADAVIHIGGRGR